MFSFSYKTAGLVTCVFSLALLSLNVLLYETNSKQASVSRFSLKNIPQPKSENWTRIPPEEKQGLPFLSKTSILKGNKKIDGLHISIGKKSKIIFTERKVYSLGEEIKLKIILYNARGEKMLRGGDYLRLWMENVKVKAAVSGKVMDHDDGSYSGTLKAMWSGEAVIGVMILVRREELVLSYQLYNSYHALWHNYAEFANGRTAEVCECSVAPYDNKQKWCNLTLDNAGFPWFCTKPKKPGLSCSMWTRSWSGLDLRKIASKAVLSRLCGRSNERDLVPNTSLRISGISDRIISPETSCNRITPELTWNRKSPKGFFYNDQWHSTECTDTMTHTPIAYRECLRGRTLYLHGDSTSGQFIDYLTGILRLGTKVKGHNPKIRTDILYNFTLSWYAHELPFYHGRVHYNKSVNLAQHVILDKMQSNSRDIIILYLYVHLTVNHPDVFKHHVHRLVQSVHKLISRAPGVTIAVRGPHAFRKTGRCELLNSYWGLHFRDILQKEFASLRKKVIFLDYWDMTMARSTDVHPPRKTIMSMVQYMMSIICNRK